MHFGQCFCVVVLTLYEVAWCGYNSLVARGCRFNPLRKVRCMYLFAWTLVHASITVSASLS
uniref:Uncharacterized protein n=1 Tax=Arundo donax TaxID=35708 RepID=A0A0A9E5V3_ARUDO